MQAPTHRSSLRGAALWPAGRPYPPPLAQSIRLHQLLAPGRLDRAWTGGGCLLRPLNRSKGRYVLVVRQEDSERADQRLAQLPPFNAWEAARFVRHQQQQQEQAADAAAAARAFGAAAPAAAAAEGG